MYQVLIKWFWKEIVKIHQMRQFQSSPNISKIFPLKNITLILRISFDESTNDCKHDWHEGWNSRRGWSYRIDGGCYLRFRQRERLRQLLPLRADDVVIFLERVLQLQQLTGAEGRPYSLRLPEWLEEKARYVGTWNTQRQETHMNYSMSLPGYEMKLFPWFMLARANERNCRVGITLVLNLKKNVSSRHVDIDIDLISPITVNLFFHYRNIFISYTSFTASHGFLAIPIFFLYGDFSGGMKR